MAARGSPNRPLFAYARDLSPEGGPDAAVQHGLLADWCQARGWRITGSAEDEWETPADLDRPGLGPLLTRLAVGEAEALALARLDALAWSPTVLAPLFGWCAEAGVDLVCLDPRIDTGREAGRRAAALVSRLAEFQRQAISARGRAGAAAARAGRRPAGRPSVADDPALAERIRGMRNRGLSLRAIAEQLNGEGVPTPRGGAFWRASSVQVAAGYRRPPRPPPPPAGLPPRAGPTPHPGRPPGPTRRRPR